jgi:hypothetical protein
VFIGKHISDRGTETRRRKKREPTNPLCGTKNGTSQISVNAVIGEDDLERASVITYYSYV